MRRGRTSPSAQSATYETPKYGKGNALYEAYPMEELRQMHLKTPLLVLFSACLSFAASNKISPDLRKLPSAPADVLIQFATTPAARHHERIATKGGRLKHNFAELMNAAAYTVSSATLEELAADPDVLYISPDRKVKATLDYANPATGAGRAFQYGYSGAGITVAVIDSGVNDSIADLQGQRGSRVLYSQSFVPNDRNTQDLYGHGTHVAGIIAGNAALSSGAGYSRFFSGNCTWSKYHQFPRPGCERSR
jgi:serine protease AprX